MFEKKKCKNCASFEKLTSMRDQRDRAEDTARAIEYQLDDLQAERAMRVTFERMTARLQEEIRILKNNNEALERETRYLQEKLQAEEGEAVTMRDLFCGLRERIYTLLRSADQDAEVFGLPRYTLLDIKTLEHTAEHDDLTAYLGRMADKYGVDEVHTEAHRDCIHKRVDGRCGLGEEVHTCLDGPCPFEMPGNRSCCIVNPETCLYYFDGVCKASSAPGMQCRDKPDCGFKYGEEITYGV